MARKKLDIEACFTQLEGVIEELEGGDLPLEQALQRYEVGLDRLNQARRQLDAYSKRVAELDALLEPIPGDDDAVADDDDLAYDAEAEV